MTYHSKTLKKILYSAYTEKGVQHFMNLHNGWQEVVDHYNQYAYIPIEKMECINGMPTLLDESGVHLLSNLMSVSTHLTWTVSEHEKPRSAVYDWTGSIR